MDECFPRYLSNVHAGHTYMKLALISVKRRPYIPRPWDLSREPLSCYQFSGRNTSYVKNACCEEATSHRSVNVRRKRKTVLGLISHSKGMEGTVSNIYRLAASFRRMLYVQTGRLRRCMEATCHLEIFREGCHDVHVHHSIWRKEGGLRKGIRIAYVSGVCASTRPRGRRGCPRPRVFSWPPQEPMFEC